jgi:hypothetical protein
MTDNRVHVPDPALIYRAGIRSVLALPVILILSTVLISWGVTLLAAGEALGLPFAVGGVVLAISVIAITTATLGIRRSLDQDSISRESLLKARRIAKGVSFASLATVLALILFGLVRGLMGEWWSMLTTLLISVVLYVFGRAARNVAKAQTRSLSGITPNP